MREVLKPCSNCVMCIETTEGPRCAAAGGILFAAAAVDESVDCEHWKAKTPPMITLPRETLERWRGLCKLACSDTKCIHQHRDMDCPCAIGRLEKEIEEVLKP